MTISEKYENGKKGINSCFFRAYLSKKKFCYVSPLPMSFFCKNLSQALLFCIIKLFILLIEVTITLFDEPLYTWI